MLKMCILKYQLYTSEYVYIHLNAYEQGIQLDPRKDITADHIIIACKFIHDNLILLHIKPASTKTQTSPKIGRAS